MYSLLMSLRGNSEFIQYLTNLINSCIMGCRKSIFTLVYFKFYPDVKYRKLEENTPPQHFYILKCKKSAIKNVKQPARLTQHLVLVE